MSKKERKKLRKEMYLRELQRRMEEKLIEEFKKVKKLVCLYGFQLF